MRWHLPTDTNSDVTTCGYSKDGGDDDDDDDDDDEDDASNYLIRPKVTTEWTSREQAMQNMEKNINPSPPHILRPWAKSGIN